MFLKLLTQSSYRAHVGQDYSGLHTSRQVIGLIVMGVCLAGLSACESMPQSEQPKTTTVMAPASNLPANNRAANNANNVPPSTASVADEATAVAKSPSAPVANPNPLTQDSSSDKRTPSAASDSNTGYRQTPFGTDRTVIITAPEDFNTPSPSQGPSNGRTNPPTISMPSNPVNTSRQALLERARRNSSQRFSTKAQPVSNGDNLPAFRQLIQRGRSALNANRLTEAQNSFTRAQRLAPKSSLVYFYLSQVAIKKNQPRKAEAMARRGLVVTQDNGRRRALWQLILQSGQMQRNSKIITEATKALR